jgi:hypothetical protein
LSLDNQGYEQRNERKGMIMGRRMIKNGKPTTTAAINKALWVKWKMFCAEQTINPTDYVESILWRWLKENK